MSLWLYIVFCDVLGFPTSGLLLCWLRTEEQLHRSNLLVVLKFNLVSSKRFLALLFWAFSTGFPPMRSYLWMQNVVVASWEYRGTGVFDYWCLRRILRTDWAEWTSDMEIKGRYCDIKQLSIFPQRRWLQWFGHVLWGSYTELSTNFVSRTIFGVVLSPWRPVENVSRWHCWGRGTSRLRISLRSLLPETKLGGSLYGSGLQPQRLLRNDSGCPWGRLISQLEIVIKN